MPENTPVFNDDTESLRTEQLTLALERGLGDMSAHLLEHMDNLADLSFMLQHEGHPMSMEKFYMFRDLFSTMPPKRTLYKTGRQVAKTTSAGASNTLGRTIRDNTKSLIVTPFFQQVHRISTEVMAPMASKGLFQDSILDGSAQQVLKRKYRNGSIDHFSYAFMSCERIRSISGIDLIWLDEIQNIKAEFIPVIEQTSAARPMTGWKWYTGTPLSMANQIQTLWEQSSQAVESVKCEHCGRWNLGCVEEHLIQMIGPHTCVCYHCSKPLDVMKKVFIPRFPDREEDFQGRHISQVMHPLHALIPAQWKELRRHMEDYTTAQFHNEVLGESYDSADRMIDLQSLRDACTLGPNTLEEALSKRKELEIAGIGVDWTGGGDGHSLTKVVLGGVRRGSNELKVLHMLEMPKSMPIQAQIPEIMRLVEKFMPNLLAHDYTGAGWLFESLGLNLQLDPSLIWPFEYGHSPNREVVYANEARSGLRSSLHLDHTRSLFAIYSMIKGGRVKFPDWEAQKSPDSNSRPVDDFMHMFSESRPGLRSGEVLYIRRDSGHSDDYVHAVNFLATACWYLQGAYPSIPGTNLNGQRLQPTDEEAAGMDGSFMMHPGYDDDDDDLENSFV